MSEPATNNFCKTLNVAADLLFTEMTKHYNFLEDLSRNNALLIYDDTETRYAEVFQGYSADRVWSPVLLSRDSSVKNPLKDWVRFPMTQGYVLLCNPAGKLFVSQVGVLAGPIIACSFCKHNNGWKTGSH
ncbi:Oidioi.mRNA.OKI2018_I69.chr1.g1626.t1.cds [Oikopleura dioica]|uniref:Oidioi.mRNA.OKI2018_I69.chr1.g1626.t1.cds n=1 Tax=Oikopleura dioica TaxID=34765 RepID=A0ABN7STJ9_OIKDI|nr:Oidioi.mRNA.OKI2018_I69.chr1.g1626.t1.cds [Oikopleura dioica]